MGIPCQLTPCSVSDPYSFFSGSGSRGRGWRSIRIRIQSGSRALMTKNWKKITAEKINKKFFWSKTAIYLSLGLYKVCPSYRRSLQLTKEAIQHLKTWIYFCGTFLPSWIRIRIPNTDPDPLARMNTGTDPIRIRIRNPATRQWLPFSEFLFSLSGW